MCGEGERGDGRVLSSLGRRIRSSAAWVLGFGSVAAPAWNHVIVGLLVVALAAWELWEVPQKATA